LAEIEFILISCYYCCYCCYCCC